MNRVWQRLSATSSILRSLPGRVQAWLLPTLCDPARSSAGLTPQPLREALGSDNNKSGSLSTPTEARSAAPTTHSGKPASATTTPRPATDWSRACNTGFRACQFQLTLAIGWPCSQPSRELPQQPDTGPSASTSMKTDRRGRSPAEMREMRRKYGLGEFRARGSRPRKRGRRRDSAPPVGPSL